MKSNKTPKLVDCIKRSSSVCFRNSPQQYSPAYPNYTLFGFLERIPCFLIYIWNLIISLIFFIEIVPLNTFCKN